MRIAFISDIHGNFTALEAVLSDIKGQSVDQVICLGDTATLGPQPREVLDALRHWKTVNIQGNHDAAILDPERAAEYEITDYLVPDLYWGREHLTANDFEFIRSFQSTYELDFGNNIQLLAFHGSPRATTDLILATTPAETLDEHFGPYHASVFIGGHSHIQMHRRYGKLLILNSGSVGNAFLHAFSPGKVPSLLPWAEYAILEYKQGLFDVDLRRVYFDTQSLQELVKVSGLPGAAWWLRQYQNGQ